MRSHGAKLYRGWNLHHLDLNTDHYTDISDPSHFACLNAKSHEIVHAIWGKSGKDWRKKIERLTKLLEKMEQLNCSSHSQ